MLIQNHSVDLPTPTGPMRTYVYQPVDTGKYPTLIFYSEIFQQTGPIRRAAQMLAGHGFIVLVPEVFHELNPLGCVLGYDNDGRDKGNADKAQKYLEDHDTDTQALIIYSDSLPNTNGAIGTMGVCLGGHLAFRAALNMRIAAASCFYATDIHTGGIIPAQAGNETRSLAHQIKGALQMVWGKQDPHIPASGRAEVYQLLSGHNLNFTWHEFNGQHAFMRDEGERYDAELHLLGFQMAIGFFQRYLKHG
jgi:carboxymethylenebutenolidase